MEELYLLDKELNRKDIIDTYSSLIWAKRYNDVGDFELVIAATEENITKIINCEYIMRNDDDMVCRINKIEITTDNESGSQLLIVKGNDIKDILKQRIIIKQTNFNGFVEEYIRTLINESIINPTEQERRIDNFVLADKNGYTEKINEQITYDNLGEKIIKLCQKYEWGNKIYIENGNFVFSLYKGNDLSENVTFSAEYDNISTTTYSKDNSNIKNFALVAGEGEGAERKVVRLGTSSGINRYEVYIDVRDISSNIEYKELKNNYPNGTEKVVNNQTFYQINGVNIARIDKNEEGEIQEVRLCEEIYLSSLTNTGSERLSKYMSITSFSGEVLPNEGYKYKEDYNLGDIVNIANEFGISVNARITEIIESQDESGYTIIPTFKNIEQ